MADSKAVRSSESGFPSGELSAVRSMTLSGMAAKTQTRVLPQVLLKKGVLQIGKLECP